nr:hypothetical protein CTI12_AA621550 [Tanacetum cinerariifolium]
MPCNLVEYCCFRFLCKDDSEIHPCLKGTCLKYMTNGVLLRETLKENLDNY